MTYSIVARCPRTGMLGVATASKALAAGSLVPYCRPGAGAIASQAFVNPYLGIDGISLLEHSLPAERVLERLVEGDTGRDLRQIGIVDKDGRVAAYTGERCIPYAGEVTGGGYACLGNILAGEAVLKAMSLAFEISIEDDLPERLVEALEAGDEAGGDRRGRQSAGIVVVAQEEYPWCDLRVDDHPDPVAELRRLLDLFRREGAPFRDMMAQRTDYTPHWDVAQRTRDQIEESLAEEEAEARAGGSAGAKEQ